MLLFERSPQIVVHFVGVACINGFKAITASLCRYFGKNPWLLVLVLFALCSCKLILDACIEPGLNDLYIL